MRANASGVVARRGELDVEQLERRLDVGGRARPLDAVRRQRDEGRGRRDLARRQLRQVDRAMATGAGQLDLSGRQLRLDELLRRRERAAAGRRQREQDLIVLEVSRLEPCLDAVRQPDDGDAELGDLAPSDDRARIRRASEQHGAAGRVGPGRHRDRIGRCNRRRELRVGRHRHAGLLRRDRQDHAARVGEHRLGGRGHIRGRDRRHERLHELLLVLDPGRRFALQEVVHVLLHVGSALGLVALRVGAVVAGEHPLARAVQLAGAEAVLLDAIRLDFESGQAAFDLAFLNARGEREVADRRREGPAVGARAQERRVGLPRDLVEPVVQHLVRERAHQAAAIVAHLVLRLARALPHDGDRRLRRLGVGRHLDQHFRLQRQRIVARRRRRRGLRQRRELLLDQRLERGRIHVSHGHDRHAIGPVPLGVERPQLRRTKRLQDLGLADRQPLGVLRLGEQHRDLLVAQPRSGAEPAPPFLDDDAALLVDLFRIERHPAGKIGQRLHALLDDAGLVGGQLKHVDRVVEAGLRVDVRPQTRAGRFERGDQFAWLEMRGAVEPHVLQEVGQALLRVGLVDRAGLDGELQHDALLRTRVLADVVAQPVRERAGRDRRIERDHRRRRECSRRLRSLRVGRRPARGRRDEGDRRSVGSRDQHRGNSNSVGA